MSATSTSRDGRFESRIEELLKQMTLTEKVGQLTQFSGFHDITGPSPSGGREAQKHALLKEGLIGSMLNVIGTEQTRIYQDFAVNNSRLGIPMLFSYDVIHGQKTMFPIPLAEAASWDLELIERSARVAAIEASAQGLHWTFAPMIDISRDARWGRVMEGAGEDSYLGSAIAEARVNGFQGDDLTAPDTIMATIKHFAAYGFAESGRDYNTAEIGTVTLFNEVLMPFRRTLAKTNPRSVMNAFNTINGIPCTGDEYLQRDVLKGEWDFDGVVVSDWGSALEMIEHGFAEDARHAAKLAIQAGSDVDMESNVYLDHLEELVESGEVDMAHVDDAVRRVLRVKFELGLFDDPYRYIDAERERTHVFTDQHLDDSLKIARKSIVLLKNDNYTLPLAPEKRVALIGALAADKDTPLGNWRAQADSHSAMSVLEGFEAAQLKHVYSRGVEVQIGEAGFIDPVTINKYNRDGLEEAVQAARDADQVVMVLGETGRQSGEGRSRTKIGLPGLQQEMLEAVHAVNPNIIMVVMSGRPLDLSWADAHIPAILQVWHLGHKAGEAITDVLTGKENPSGKLPMSFPRSVGQIPIYYNHLSTGRPAHKQEVVWSHYNDELNSPLYAFGHGLSYSRFDYRDLHAGYEDGRVYVAISVTNDSNIEGEEVVQLYMRDCVAGVARPVKELRGFEKIKLTAGKFQRVVFWLTKEDLGYYDPKGDFKLEPGDFDFFVGGSSLTDLQIRFELTPDHIKDLLA